MTTTAPITLCAVTRQSSTGDRKQRVHGRILTARRNVAEQGAIAAVLGQCIQDPPNRPERNAQVQLLPTRPLQSPRPRRPPDVARIQLGPTIALCGPTDGLGDQENDVLLSALFQQKQDGAYLALQLAPDVTE